MFPSFIGILDIQSWWEVPSIAYFCSLFRTAFNLLDFDIEELEEALLTDGTEESASSLLTELIVRLLNGCQANNDVSAFNYQMYLRRLFRRKCQDSGRYNPFNTDIDFQFLPLRTKVEILYALCDFRLDGDDVFDLFKNLEAESLRVEPLGWDDNGSAYWYFYGTRLYREDITKKSKGKSKKKKGRHNRRGLLCGDDWLHNDVRDRVWQVVCFTEEDWNHLTDKFSKATSKVEKELYHSLSQNFLPEIPRLFQEKERLQRKRLLETAPRRTSSRVLQKIRQKEEETKLSENELKDSDPEPRENPDDVKAAREHRAKRRLILRVKSETSDSSDTETEEAMPQKSTKKLKSREKRSKNSSKSHKGEPPPDVPIRAGRKTNNSLANETGQIVIPENDEPVNSTRKKLKTSQIFSQSEEDIQTDMYKILEQLIAHDDAWPFVDPVEEEYAPNYYAVIRRPMDLKKMEERLDAGYYTDFSMFKGDFKLIVNNCRLYNGQDNEYTMMVDNLQAAFDRLIEKYVDRLSSSDEEIAVEYQIPTPSRKHKLKSAEPPPILKKKKRKSISETGERKSSSDCLPDDIVQERESPKKTSGESHHKSKEGKIKKKRKGHHRHGKHSKNHKKNHKTGHNSKGSKHTKTLKYLKDKAEKKKRLKKKNKQLKELEVSQSSVKRSLSHDSAESSNRSRSASPLPSIHTPSPTPPPTPTPTPPPPIPADLDPDFYKDKYDKIKERRRAAAKDAWEALVDHKHKAGEKNNSNLDKDKNPKLRETIEKLKAKNENYKEAPVFGSIFASKKKDLKSKKEKDLKGLDEDSQEEIKEKHKPSKKTKKVAVAKNESASQALEQAVKDISKWLDEAPKGSTFSSPCDSPAQTISTEEQDSRQDDEFLQADKNAHSRKESSRKRPSSREPKVLKKREVQRTIERLQPGKSKGNLLLSSGTKPVEKDKESSPVPTKARDNIKPDETSMKLSLGSVLPPVEFTIGKDHNFDNDEEVSKEKPVISNPPEDTKDATKEEPPEKKSSPPAAEPEKKPEEPKVEPEPEKPVILSQEKATPNLSAWFKAFGTPKSATSSPAAKKKPEDVEPEEKPVDTGSETKPPSPKIVNKFDSPSDSDPVLPEEGDSPPTPAVSGGGRQRRTSTGSSVSERSSYSQDLDSPRHQLAHNSPQVHSPASPRTDDFQKITYPIINGTVRAGFYQDTTSVRSSPEKSCSPREGPKSPYSPYSQHIYASNNAIGSSTPNYFVDQNKSPSLTYGQSQPQTYFDSSKGTSSLGDTYHQGQFSGSYSPVGSPYGQSQPPTYSQPQQSPQLPARHTPEHNKTTQVITENKNSLFPMKKRTYNEIESPIPAKKQADNKSIESDYQRMVHTLHSNVSDHVSHINETPELTICHSHEKEVADIKTHFEGVSLSTTKVPANLDLSKASLLADSIDMVNMGYMNPENERRNSGDTRDDFFSRETLHKSNLHSHPKGYEIDTIAMNLGINNQNMQKALAKSSAMAHSHERSHAEMAVNTNQAHAHTHAHTHEFDNPAGGHAATNFSLSDIELANKKLYSTPPSANPLDYGNWKPSAQAKKHDTPTSEYLAAYNAQSMEKLKSDISAVNAAAMNYNKNMQHQQHYHNYSVSRASLQRSQDIPHTLQSELRIPNPRNLIKNDHSNTRTDHHVSTTSTNSSDNIAKETDANTKHHKTDKHIQNHPLVGSLQYKTPYSTHSSLPIDSLRNLPNIPQMLERYTTEDRYLSSFAAGSASLYHDKTFQMAQMSQMFNKSIASDVHAASTAASVYSQSSATVSKESNVYKTTPSSLITPAETKTKPKRKRTSDTKPATSTYHPPSHPSDVLSSVKSSMVPGSAFNFGATPNMGIGSGLYPDNSGFTIEDFRNSTNQLMAANYMAAAVAHQRSSAESSGDKIAKPAHQNSSGSFGLMGHSSGQARGGYGFVPGDPSSPLYQQYLQRHQEELLRQTGAQIMGLYPPGYGAALAARQSYDSINRPSWL